MNTLDRYIARQFVMNIVILLTLLGLFIALIDISVNIEQYLLRAGEGGATGVRRMVMLALYAFDLWWPRLLQLFGYVNGLVLVGAMGFTFAQLVRHRELVAMMAGGVSLFRSARPVLLIAGVMLVLQVANQELVIPRMAPLLARSIKDAGKRDFDAFAVRLTADGQGRVLMARQFDPKEGRITGLYVLERDETGRAVRRITADVAQWDGKQWNLSNGQARSMQIGSFSPTDPRARAAEPVAVIATTLDPTALVANQYKLFSQTLSWAQLAEGMSLPGLQKETHDQMARIAWGRLSALISTVLSLVIALPFFLTREPRNMVVQSLKCAPIALGCLLGGVLGAAAPIPAALIPPAVAVFLPVLIMLPVAIAQGTSIKT